MRESDWQIRWDATGESPRVLLDFGDLMGSEISRVIEQLADVAAFDFDPSSVVASRGNVRRRLEHSRRVSHATNAGSWDACHSALAADPWGVKAILSVKPRIGVTRFYAAALLSSSHEPSTDGPEAESVHGYVFRVSPVSAMVLPGGIVIIGGHFNLPSEYVVPPLPPGVSLPPGTNVEVSGTPGMIDGNYTVGGSGLPAGGSGSVEIEPTPEPEPVENLSAPFITGTPWPGEPLSAIPGDWAHATLISPQWWLNGAFTGVIGLGYTIPIDAQEGDVIFYQEIASNSLGSAGAQSNHKIVVEPPFQNLTPPSIVGGSTPGSTLTAIAGTWQSADEVTGEWYFNDTATGEIISTYNIPETAEDGDQIFYRETATKAGHDNQTAASTFITVALFDTSPVFVPAADQWVGAAWAGSGRSYHVAVRKVTFVLEWKNLPAGTKILIESWRWVSAGESGSTQLYTSQTISDLAGDGSGNAETSTELQVEVYPPGFDPSDDVSVFSGYLNGNDYTAASATTHADFTVDEVRQVKFLRSNPNLKITVKDTADNVLANYNLTPGFTTTFRMRIGAPAVVTYASERAMRLVYDDSFNLLVPDGFIVS